PRCNSCIDESITYLPHVKALHLLFLKDMATCFLPSLSYQAQGSACSGLRRRCSKHKWQTAISGRAWKMGGRVPPHSPQRRCGYHLPSECGERPPESNPP